MKKHKQTKRGSSIGKEDPKKYASREQLAAANKTISICANFFDFTERKWLK